MLALSAHLAGCTSVPRRRARRAPPELAGAQDLASLAPPPRNGEREEVEGADEAEERAHGEGTAAATWKPMAF
jgi:hypothetical protein